MKPAFFDTNASARPKIIDPERTPDETYYIPMIDIYDPAVYISHDLEENGRIHGNHNSIYIDGKLGENAYIYTRLGCVSASSLGPHVEITCALPVIISNLDLSRQSKNIDSGRNDPLIIVTPEENRAAVFDYVMQHFYRNPKPFEDEQLQATITQLVKAFPGIRMRFLKGGCDMGPATGRAT